jgi:endonuclease-3
MVAKNQKQTIALKALRLLSQAFPGKAMVDFGTAEDTLIATLLSARTRDEQVISVYPDLRNKFRTLQDLADASWQEIATTIARIGLYQNKAKAVNALARMLLDQFKGKVPKTMEELVLLPGVGRKTASCVLAYAFKIPAIAVDTHVFRIAHRLGWAKGDTPEIVEEELKQLFQRTYWIEINRMGVKFGRTICIPGRPRCWQCPVRRLCPYEPKTPDPKKK